MKPGRIAGKGGMRQKTAENSTGKRNNVENFIEIVVFAVLVGIASAVTLWLFTGSAWKVCWGRDCIIPI